jgi:hypothetical protein
MRNPDLYRGRYFMALYDRRDRLILVADNAHDLASQIGKKAGRAQEIMCRLFPGNQNHINFVLVAGRQCVAYFYQMDDSPAVCSIEAWRREAGK